MKRTRRKSSMRTDTRGGPWLLEWGRRERRLAQGQRRAERKRQARREQDER